MLFISYSYFFFYVLREISEYSDYNVLPAMQATAQLRRYAHGHKYDAYGHKYGANGHKYDKKTCDI